MADERRKSRKPMGFHGKTLAKTLVRTSFGSHLVVLEEEYRSGTEQSASGRIQGLESRKGRDRK